MIITMVNLSIYSKNTNTNYTNCHLLGLFELQDLVIFQLYISLQFNPKNVWPSFGTFQRERFFTNKNVMNIWLNSVTHAVLTILGFEIETNPKSDFLPKTNTTLVPDLTHARNRHARRFGRRGSRLFYFLFVLYPAGWDGPETLC